MFRRAGILLVAAAWAMAPSAWAQTFRGGIQGTVVDTSDAPVPGATVTASRPATGLRRSVITDASGLYSIPELPLGEYDVTVELSGFGSQTVRSVRVDASADPVPDRRPVRAQLRRHRQHRDPVRKQRPVRLGVRELPR